MKHGGQPVFVDGTGRRRKLIRGGGIGLGALFFGYAILLGVSLGTGADVPMTTWVTPGKGHRPEAGEVPLRKKSARTPVPGVTTRPAGPVAAVTPSATPRPTTKPTVDPTVKPTAAETAAVAPTEAATHGKKPTSPPGQEKKNRDRIRS